MLFALTSLILIVLLVVTVMHGFRSQWSGSIRPHMQQYLDYVVADIGNPPDRQRATELAARLPINIYIEGPSERFSTSGGSLKLQDLEFHRRPHRRHRRYPHHDVEWGEHNDRSVLRSRLGEHTVYYELRHSRRGGHDNPGVRAALVGLLLILLGCYLALRRMLRPVQDIKLRVQKMGAGQLQSRVPVRADNDLGALAGSINSMAADIEQMLDAKRQLLLGASHELRSPITRAKVAVQMLPASGNRDSIARDLDEMSSLISEILESERMKGGHSVLERRPVVIADLLQAVLAELQQPAVDVTIDAAVSVAQLDETRIKLLLRNLLSNALNHGQGGKVRIAIQQRPAAKAEPGAQRIEIVVADDGPGIDAAHLARLTEPFYRADPSRTRATGGFGLGLHLCQLIAAAHGGELAIASAPGQGTTVSVWLAG